MSSTKEKFKQIIGVKGGHLIDPRSTLETYHKLGLTAGSEFLANLERRRLVNRVLFIMFELCVLAMLSTMANGNFEGAIPYMIAGVIFYVGTFAEASHRTPLVETYLKEIQLAVQKRGLGSLAGETNSAISEVLKFTVNERLLKRPIDPILLQFIESAVVSLNKPAVIPLLLGSSMLLLWQSTLARKLFQKAYSSFLEQQDLFLQNDSDTDHHAAMVKADTMVGASTIPINAISQLLRLVGFYLAGGVGLVGYAFAEAKSVAFELTGLSQSVTGATEANRRFETLQPEIHKALIRQITTQADYDAHKQASNGEHLPPDISQRLQQQGISEALVAYMTLNLPNGRHVPIRAVIDFSKNAGAFHIFGRNGSGKTELAKALAQYDDNHTGEVALVDRRPGGEVANLHNLPLGELRQQILFWRVETDQCRKGSFLERSGMDRQQAITHLHKLGFERLVPLIDRDLSQDISTSKGEKRMLLAISFLHKAHQEHKAQLVIMDELYAEVDDAHVLQLRALVDAYQNDFRLNIIVITQDSEFFTGRGLSVHGAVISNDGFYAFPTEHKLAERSEATLLFSRSTSIESNPHFIAKTWEKDPIGFIRTVNDRDPDATQVVFLQQLLAKKSSLDPDYRTWLAETHPTLWAELETHSVSEFFRLSHVCSYAIMQWIEAEMPFSEKYIIEPLPLEYYSKMWRFYLELGQYLRLAYTQGILEQPFKNAAEGFEARTRLEIQVENMLSNVELTQRIDIGRTSWNLSLPSGESVPLQTAMAMLASEVASRLTGRYM